MVQPRAKFLFHINMQPPALLFSLHSAHMFLFKASRADCDDWCAHYPPAQCFVQRLAPKGRRGEAFPPDRTVDFPQGNFTVLPVICSSVFPLRPPVDCFVPSFSFCLSVSTLVHSCLGHGTTLGAACCNCRQPYCLIFFFLFWYLQMLLSALLWPGSWLSFMATHSGRCSKVGSLCFDWSGRQEPGAGPWRCTQCLVVVA